MAQCEVQCFKQGRLGATPRPARPSGSFCQVQDSTLEQLHKGLPGISGAPEGSALLSTTLLFT